MLLPLIASSFVNLAGPPSLDSCTRDMYPPGRRMGLGVVLRMALGIASATAHRGIRHLRMPTTTLSQGDGGVGVKNGVNFFNKKNWVGTFSVPRAVVIEAVNRRAPSATRSAPMA